MTTTLKETIRLLSPQNQCLFACDCAERALLREREAGRDPENRSWNAVAVAREYAMGMASKEALEKAFAASFPSYYSYAYAYAAAASFPSYYSYVYAYAAASYAASSYAYANEKEESWQLERATAYLDAQLTAKTSLISILQQRATQLGKAVPSWKQETEEALF